LTINAHAAGVCPGDPSPFVCVAEQLQCGASDDGPFLWLTEWTNCDISGFQTRDTLCVRGSAMDDHAFCEGSKPISDPTAQDPAHTSSSSCEGRLSSAATKRPCTYGAPKPLYCCDTVPKCLPSFTSSPRRLLSTGGSTFGKGPQLSLKGFPSSTTLQGRRSSPYTPYCLLDDHGLVPARGSGGGSGGGKSCSCPPTPSPGTLVIRATVGIRSPGSAVDWASQLDSPAQLLKLKQALLAAPAPAPPGYPCNVGDAKHTCDVKQDVCIFDSIDSACFTRECFDTCGSKNGTACSCYQPSPWSTSSNRHGTSAESVLRWQALRITKLHTAHPTGDVTLAFYVEAGTADPNTADQLATSLERSLASRAGFPLAFNKEVMPEQLIAVRVLAKPLAETYRPVPAPTPPTPAPAPPPRSGGLGAGAIVGIVFGAIIGLAAVGLLIFGAVRLWQQRSQDNQLNSLYGYSGYQRV